MPTSHIQPCNLLRQATVAESGRIDEHGAAERGITGMTPSQRVSSSDFCPAVTAMVDCKCCYCEVEICHSLQHSVTSFQLPLEMLAQAKDHHAQCHEWSGVFLNAQAGSIINAYGYGMRCSTSMNHPRLVILKREKVVYMIRLLEVMLWHGLNLGFMLILVLECSLSRQ